MNVSHSFRCLVALACAFGAASVAQAVDVTVDCSKKNSKTINATLATLDKIVPNKVTIVGVCTELVVIERFRDLTIIGSAGASINDPTPSNADEEVDIVLSIGPQSNVTLRSLTVNGGASGVSCFQMSICTLEDVIVQGAAGDGVGFGRSTGTISGNTIIRNNHGSGLALGASVVAVGPLVDGGPAPQIIDNDSHGVRMNDNSTLRGTVTIEDNGGHGVNAFAAAVFLSNAVVNNNVGPGVSLRSSTLRGTGFGGPGDLGLTIKNNGGNGVSVGPLSFLTLGGLRTISSNASPDVNCASTTAATSGTGGSDTPDLGGGSTNCPATAP